MCAVRMLAVQEVFAACTRKAFRPNVAFLFATDNMLLQSGENQPDASALLQAAMRTYEAACACRRACRLSRGAGRDLNCAPMPSLALTASLATCRLPRDVCLIGCTGIGIVGCDLALNRCACAEPPFLQHHNRRRRASHSRASTSMMQRCADAFALFPRRAMLAL